jgi:hypothetical protein
VIPLFAAVFVCGGMGIWNQNNILDRRSQIFHFSGPTIQFYFVDDKEG